MSSSARSVVALVGATVLAALLPVAAAHVTSAAAETTITSASHPFRSPNVAHSTVNASAAKRSVGYWTRERMASAQPFHVRPRPTTTRGTAPAATTPVAPATSVPPTAGDLGSFSAVARAATELVRPYTNLPDRLNARLFFTAGGTNYVCSGTLVNSTSKRMVSTAGHCVSNGAGRWHENMVVVPGYSSRCDGCGGAPYGRWAVRTMTARTQWHQQSNFKHDVAFLVTRDRDGRRMVDALGGQGIRFNVARSQQFRAYGYPAARPFSGFTQYVCPSGWLADDDPTSQPGPLTLRIGCTMTGGASGGGWIIRQDGGLGFLNGVNSYRYVSGPTANANHMYGPYFGTAAQSLYRYTVGLG